LLLQSKETLFPLRSEWSLRLATLVHGRVVELQSGRTLGTPSSDAPSFATALGYILRVGVLCCVVVGRPPNPLFPLR
jgi:hypothetical protein